MKIARSHSQRSSVWGSTRPGGVERVPAQALSALLGTVGQVFYWDDPSGQKEIAFLGDVKRILGLSKAELAGGRAEWLSWVHPDDLSRLKDGLAAAATGKPQLIEYRYRRPGRSLIWIRETICPVRDSKTSPWMLAGMITDISEARQSAVQFRHYQKMCAFGELAGSVAHDFNNLLTLFQGYTELLQVATDPRDPNRAYLDEMAVAVDRARELTAQLHRFSRRKPGNGPEPVELGSFLKELHRMLRRLTGERIEWTLTLKIQSGWVLADPVMLESLLVNLAVNASEAMPKGGRIGVKLSGMSLRSRDRRVVEEGWRPGRYLCLEVSDTGEGIRKADLERIFEPGFTTRGLRGAEGMGLPTCRKIVCEFGGRITVRSTPGKGSVFQVFLPAIPPPLQGDEADGAEPIPPGKGEKILIVEDDAITRKALALMVRRLGYRVQSAPNGNAAWNLLQKDSKIRLVIADLVMPIMGGNELVDLVQHRRPEVRFLVISGYVHKPQIKKHTDIVFLPKPLQPRVLAHYLRKLLDV